MMITGGVLRNGRPQVATFVQSQAESVRNLGWRVHLGVVDDRTSPGGILRNIRRLRAESAAFEPMLVHAQYGSVVAAVGHAIRGGRPLAVSFCGDELLGTPGGGLKWRLRERAARWISCAAAHRADAIIVKSRNLGDALPPRLRERAVILPNGVDLEFFRPLDRDESRGLLGWSREARIVLFNTSHGMPAIRKNLELARAVVERTAALLPGVTLQTMSRNPPPEVRLMLNAADCLLVTSIHEGSPNIVKEAMACNLPVVSVDCGDAVERLRQVRPGAVGGRRPAELAEAVRGVLAAPARSNGRAQLRLQGLDAAAAAERLVDLYRRLL